MTELKLFQESTQKAFLPRKAAPGTGSPVIVIVLVCGLSVAAALASQGFFLPAVLIGAIVFIAVALASPFAVLLLTVFAMFLPMNFEQWVGTSFRLTPTRLAGSLLLLAILTRLPNLPISKTWRDNRTLQLSILLFFWGLIVQIVNLPDMVPDFLAEILPGIILLSAIVMFADTEGKIETIMLVIIIAGAITVISALTQSASTDLKRLSGLSLNPNTLSLNCILGFGCALILQERGKKQIVRLLFWGFALLFLFGNFLAESRSGTIGFAVTLALLMALSIKQGKMMRLVTVALCLFLLMFWIPESYWQRMQTIPVVGKSANESSAAELDVREWMYPRGFELFLERPLMGWGFGSFPTVNGSYSTWAMHSWYLAMLCEQGVFGFLIYTAFFFSVGVSLWKCRSGNLSRGHLSITASLLGITAIGLAVCGAFAPVPYDKTIFVVAGLSVGLSRLNTLKQQGNY